MLGFPIGQTEIAIGLAIYAALLLVYPWVWMLVIPLLLPVLDLNLWSGRIFLSEFDLVLMTSVAVGLLRRENWLAALNWRKRYWLLLFIIITWQVWTTLRGLMPLTPIDGNSFVSYYSQYNSLRILKGFVWALLILPLLGQSLARGEQTAKILSMGLILSCLTGIAALLWERALFTGLMNFSREYRATGLFSVTATGGAAVDAHLMMTLPFILMLFFMWRNALAHLLGIALCCVGLYACAITFSRANYPALAVGLTVFFGGWLLQQWRDRSKINDQDAIDQSVQKHSFPARRLLPLLLVIPVIGYWFLSNPYIASRFSTTWEDLEVRFQHWSYIVGLMEGKPNSQLAGMGKGSFPREYYWSMPNGEVSSTAMHHVENGEAFIRMSKSDSKGSMYLRQRFSFQGDGSYRLKLRLRPTENQPARILVEFCERLVFQSFSECRWRGFNSSGDPTRWEEFNRTINLRGLGRQNWYGSRPVEIAILNRGINQPLDIGEVELFGPSGEQLLQNTNFEAGWDRWTLYSGDHLAWHIKNIFVDAFFEGGWPGLIILLLVLFSIYLKLWHAINDNSRLALAIAASIAAGVMVGLFDSLFDEPRITLLFYLLLWVTLSLHTRSMQPVVKESHRPSWPARAWQLADASARQAMGLSHQVWHSKYRLPALAGAFGMFFFVGYILFQRHFDQHDWMDPWNLIFTSSIATSGNPAPIDTRIMQEPGRVLLDSKQQPGLAEAFRAARDGSLIQIGSGHYPVAATLRASNVKIIAEHGAVVFGKAAGGKGALLIQGDNTYMEGLECHSVSVRDGNGVCIRLEGSGLTLYNVYFHDSQGGLMGSPRGGDVVIENSRFENMGAGNFFHGIYLLNGMNKLTIRNSIFLNTQNGGHEVKSRARHTEITDSIVAASTSRDSRLVDAPNGGNLILRNNVFIEGPNSENSDLFSWGVEGIRHQGEVVIEDNLIISDKAIANLIAYKKGNPLAERVGNNIVIGTIFGIDDDDNTVFDDREAAGIQAAPFVPRLEEKLGRQ